MSASGGVRTQTILELSDESAHTEDRSAFGMLPISVSVSKLWLCHELPACRCRFSWLIGIEGIV